MMAITKKKASEPLRDVSRNADAGELRAGELRGAIVQAFWAVGASGGLSESAIAKVVDATKDMTPVRASAALNKFAEDLRVRGVGKFSEFPRPPELNAEMEANALAAFATSAHASGTVAALRYVGSAFGAQDSSALDLAMEANILRVQAGDMKEPEAMLMAQAIAMQSMFTLLANRAGAYLDRPDLMEQYMRLAFKAQAQCRTTLETLSEMKQPRAVAFVRQANIVAGPQQVNNGAPAPLLAHGKFTQNELLEDAHGQQLDTAAPSPAGRAHPQFAAVGAVNRTAKRRR